MALTLSTPAVTQAHSGATGVVKERMEAMKEMGESIKAIAQMVTGKSTLVADGVKAGARLIAGHAGEKSQCCFQRGAISIQVRRAQKFEPTGSAFLSWRLILKKPHLD